MTEDEELANIRADSNWVRRHDRLVALFKRASPTTRRRIAIEEWGW